MCGRFTLTSSTQEIACLFGLKGVSPLAPKYNIGPGQCVFTIRQKEAAASYEFAQLQWGFLPSWAESPSFGQRLINARSETVAVKPAFRRSFTSRRCLIFANGFYEWQIRPTGKQPFYITSTSGKPFGMGGIWERWKKNGRIVETCAVLTCEAHEAMRPVHQRMPVVIPQINYEEWLDQDRSDQKNLKSFLKPLTLEETTIYPVSTHVNHIRNDGPDCTLPSEESPKHSQRTMFLR